MMPTPSGLNPLLLRRLVAGRVRRRAGLLPEDRPHRPRQLAVQRAQLLDALARPPRGTCTPPGCGGGNTTATATPRGPSGPRPLQIPALPSHARPDLARPDRTAPRPTQTRLAWPGRAMSR